MSRFRLLIFDLDGTLLDASRSVRAANLARLRAAMARGVRVGFATGRPPASAGPYAERVQPNAPLIHFNGAMVRDYRSGEVLLHRRLTRAVASAAIAVAERLGAHINLYLEDRLCIARRSETSIKSELKDGVPHTVVGDLAAHLAAAPPSSEPTKLLLIIAPERIAELIDALRAVLPAEIELCNSEPDYLEVLPSGVNKGAAARALVEHLGFDLAEAIAFGDNLNDLELLAACGLGVAMGNAHQQLAESADVVIGDHDSDAIAEFLDGFALLDGWLERR